LSFQNSQSWKDRICIAYRPYNKRLSRCANGRNFNGGYQLGKKLAELIGGKGKVINLGITVGSQTGRERNDGFLIDGAILPYAAVLPVPWFTSP